jgi:hypothetical protein
MRGRVPSRGELSVKSLLGPLKGLDAQLYAILLQLGVPFSFKAIELNKLQT